MNLPNHGKIEYLNRDGVTQIEFSHPSQNSMPGKLLGELEIAIREAGSDPASNIIVMRSSGDRTFCAGASFDELSTIDDIESGKKFFLGFANVINAMRKCPKIIIGRVQGKAVGGGVGLAAAMDYCIASKWASIKLSELALGIGPFVVGPAIQRKIGVSAFGKLAVNANEWQTAEWAKDKGLFHDVFETVEQVDTYIEYLSKVLVNSSPEAMKQIKTMLWQGTEHWDNLLEERAGISGRLLLSQYTKDAIKAFKSR